MFQFFPQCYNCYIVIPDFEEAELSLYNFGVGVFIGKIEVKAKAKVK